LLFQFGLVEVGVLKPPNIGWVVPPRHVRNKHLADAAQQWAFSSMRGSPGAKAYYQQIRARGTSHQVALRQLAN
jgi:hypothetical protein